MAAVASIGNESSGLRVLDLCRHAASTIVATASANDRLSIVQFSDDAAVVLPLTTMDEDGRKRAQDAIKGLHTIGCTNIWDGIVKGFDTIPKISDGPQRASYIFMLTDGVPSTSPPRGEIEELKKLRSERLKAFPTCPELHCFGFGYGLKSDLLLGLAVAGAGNFSFIPDASMVGTCFINAISAARSTYGYSASLRLPGGLIKAGQAGVSASVASPAMTVSKDTKEVIADIGMLPIGATRSFVFSLHSSLGADGAAADAGAADAEDPTQVLSDHNCDEIMSQISLQYFDASSGQLVRVKPALVTSADTAENRAVHRFERSRKAVSTSIMAAFKATLVPDGYTTSAKEFAGLLQDLAADKMAATAAEEGEEDVPPFDARLAAFHDDLAGQVTMAVSNQNHFEKWGQHYVVSLARTHALQICNNFKDPGVQVYAASPCFQKLRDEAEEVFKTLPPPEAPAPHLLGPRGPLATYNVNLQSYLDRTGGCFSDSPVLMADGKTTRKVSLLKKGDLVATSSGTSAKVVAVISMPVDESARLVQIGSGGAHFTSYHPVSVGSASAPKWAFPLLLAADKKAALQASITTAGEASIDRVYDLVLSEGHTVTVGGVVAVTFGHGLQEDVAAHAYFGTGAVIRDLEAMDGYEAGYVDLGRGGAERDPNTGLVVRLVQYKQ